MSAYDDEIALAPTADGRWVGHIDQHWNIGGNPNGGYLLAIVMGAMRSLGPHPDPVTVTTHYLRPGTAGEPCQVHAELVRSGRSLTTFRGGLAQSGKERIEVLAAFGDLSTVTAADASLTIDAPAMPGPEDCLQRSGDEQGIDLPILSRLDTRIHPAQARGGQAGKPEISGWIRFADGRPPDTASLPMFADAFPPSLFGLLGVIGWVPTIELTVHVRRRPAPGWVLGRFETSDLHNGRMIENGTLWDERGALVAQSRQIGLLLS